MQPISRGQAAAAIHAAGIGGATVADMVAIAEAESGLGSAQNACPNATNDWGVWQINRTYHPQYDGARLCADLNYNAQAAAAIYRSEGINAWVTWKNGAAQSIRKGYGFGELKEIGNGMAGQGARDSGGLSIGIPSPAAIAGGPIGSAASAIVDAPGAVADAAGAAADTAASVASFVGRIFDPALWARIALFVLGAGCLVAGAVVLLGGSVTPMGAARKLAGKATKGKEGAA